MNTIYFVRHAKPDFKIHDDLIRPLTEEGIASVERITAYFKDKNITRVYSSPYKRAVDTVSNISMFHNLRLELIEDFRERKITDSWIEDFESFSKQQWEDFDYKLLNGESLNEVKHRNIAALHRILNDCEDEVIVIGTHGTALSTVLNFYDETYGYDAFNQMKNKMPYIICATFDQTNLISYSEKDH